MSGLFLNFYQVDIPTRIVSIDSIEYSPYATKEAFKALKEKYPNHSFYRSDDKILILSKGNSSENPDNSIQINIDLNKKAKVLSKILERSIIDYIETIGIYRFFKNKHSKGAFPVFCKKPLTLSPQPAIMYP